MLFFVQYISLAFCLFHGQEEQLDFVATNEQVVRVTSPFL